MNMLYHIARRRDWVGAQATGTYTCSTLGKSLKDVGFIHMAFARQVEAVADFLYRGVPDLVLLKVDPDRLTSQVKVEAIQGSGERYPHVYGPLNIDAVLEVSDYAVQSDGTFSEVRESSSQ